MKKLVTFVLLMNFLSPAFAQIKNDSIHTSASKHKLNLEYNVMTNIQFESNRKYKNTKRFKRIEEGIYHALNADDLSKYRMTISYVLIDDKTNDQYPIEDILEKYLLYVSQFFKTKKKGTTKYCKIELAGDLKDITQAKKDLIGKKVFNRDFVHTDGKVRVQLVIE